VTQQAALSASRWAFKQHRTASTQRVREGLHVCGDARCDHQLGAASGMNSASVTCAARNVDAEHVDVAGHSRCGRARRIVHQDDAPPTITFMRLLHVHFLRVRPASRMRCRTLIMAHASLTRVLSAGNLQGAGVIWAPCGNRSQWVDAACCLTKGAAATCGTKQQPSTHQHPACTLHGYSSAFIVPLKLCFQLLHVTSRVCIWSNHVMKRHA
jgi:hypothetical protein